MRASPSPFSRSVALTIEGGTGVVEILGVDGRMIRRLRAPTGRVEWDARDETGRVVPRGVYFARVPGVASAVARLVKVD